MKKSILISLLVLALVIPSVAFAAWSDYLPKGLMDVGKGDIKNVIIGVIDVLLIIAGVVAVIYLIIGGYQYITSAGNAEVAAKGRTTVLNAIIGLIIIFASYLIVSFVMEQALKGGSTTPTPTGGGTGGGGTGGGTEPPAPPS